MSAPVNINSKDTLKELKLKIREFEKLSGCSVGHDNLSNDSAWEGGVFNVDEPMRIAVAVGNISNVNLRHIQMSFREFSAFCCNGGKPQKGKKHESYFVRSANFDVTKGDADKVKSAGNEYLAMDHYHRNDGTMNVPFDFIVLDADHSKSTPVETHEALSEMEITHFIYTSHSHAEDDTNFRVVIPCRITDGGFLKATIMKLLEELKEKYGLKNLYMN